MALSISHLKQTNLTVDDALHTLVEQKMQTLEKLIQSDEDNVLCDIELEKLTDSQSGNIYRAEVNLRINGTLYRAEATTDQIEKSVDEVKEELQKELRRANKKMQTLMRRGGAAIKDLLRFGR